MEIEIREPRHIPVAEMRSIVELVTAGNEVQQDGLTDRLSRCRHIITATDAGQIIGVSAVKASNPKYVKQIRTKSGYRGLPTSATELGYTYVHPEWRRLGAYKKMREARAAYLNGPLFATVRVDNKAIMSILLTAGWERVGKTWPGRQGDVCLMILPSSMAAPLLRRAQKFLAGLIR